jgi:hypothetical protein
MRLSTRLKNLEQQAPPDDSLSPRARIELVRLVGRLDALFLPWRVSVTDSKHLRSQVVIVRRQQAYRNQTEGIELRAVGASDWRVAQETRRELITLGLVSPITSSGQTVGLTITAKGDSLARSLVGLKTVSDCRWTLERLRKLQSEGSPVHERRLWQEDCYGDPVAWSHLEEGILPLLSAGLVEATSSSVGEILYRATDIELSVPSVDAVADPSLEACYFDSFNLERMQLAESESDDGELFIPLPAFSGTPSGTPS